MATEYQFHPVAPATEAALWQALETALHNSPHFADLSGEALHLKADPKNDLTFEM